MNKQITLSDIAKKINVQEFETCGVGVSGGVDSMVLLHALLLLRKEKNINIIVVHINHQLRGEESNRDELFVKDFCRENKINYICEKVDVKGNKQKNKLTEEESARILRYKAINKVINENNISQFFLAHHKNDQAETVLMHMFRGSGVKGALGMIVENTYKRPLINVSRKQILKIAKENNISYVNDSTNDKNICNRNVLRNTIMPEIEKVYPGVIDSIYKFSEHLKVDQDFIESQVPMDMIEKDNGIVKIKLEAFDLHASILYRLIKKACIMHDVDADILSVHIADIVKLSKLENGSRINLPHGLIVAKEYDYIAFYKNLKQEDVFYQFSAGEFDFGDKKVCCEYVDFNDITFGDGNLYISLDDVTGIVLRKAKTGDIFNKLGAKGSKKLVDYFTDKKIPLLTRKNVPVLAKNNEVLVVAGYDISEKVKIDKNSSNIVRISCLTKV